MRQPYQLKITSVRKNKRETILRINDPIESVIGFLDQTLNKELKIEYKQNSRNTVQQNDNDNTNKGSTSFSKDSIRYSAIKDRGTNARHSSNPNMYAS